MEKNEMEKTGLRHPVPAGLRREPLLEDRAEVIEQIRSRRLWRGAVTAYTS